MFRGGRGVTLPPLHGIADVLALCVFLLALLVLASWLFGGSPLQALANLLNPPALATVLEIHIELGKGAAAATLAAMLPVKEKASPSAALDAAQRLSEVLLGEREHWTSGGLQASRVKEEDGRAAWESVWERTSEHEPNDSAERPVVSLIALVTGRSLRSPEGVTADELERFVRGIGKLDVRNLEAFGAVSSVVGRAGALGLVPL